MLKQLLQQLGRPSTKIEHFCDNVAFPLQIKKYSFLFLYSYNALTLHECLGQIRHFERKATGRFQSSIRNPT